MTEAILATAVLAAMAGLAVHDARRALVDPRMVLALLCAAAAWRFAGPGGAEGAWPRLAAGVLGASLGVAAAMIPIGVAAWLGRRWPLYPGDAMMLGAFGFLLGVPGARLDHAAGLGAGAAPPLLRAAKARPALPQGAGAARVRACAPGPPRCSSA